MKDYKNNNDRYMKEMGMGSEKVMKNHGNTKKVKMDNQKFDMGRLQASPMMKRGYGEKAFDYKY